MIGIIDMHCHILPEVDDGARTIAKSKEMLEVAYAKGIRAIIATPHYHKGCFMCSSMKINEKYQEVKELAKRIGTGIEIFLGRECFADSELLSKINDERCLTMAASKYILVEFFEDEQPVYIRERILELICNGYMPIIAHVERYDKVKEKHIEEWVALGAKMQVNAGSMLGDNGFKIKKFCKMMMQKDYLSFVGTDAHSQKRLARMQSCANYIDKKMGREYAHKILIANPESIIMDVAK